MLLLHSLGAEIASRRKKLGLSQMELAHKASVARSTLDALENGRLGELGFSRISRVLSVLGLELTLQERRSRRPTLEDLIRQDRDAQGMDRQR